MRQRDFWSGFAVGAGVAVGAAWAAALVRGGSDYRIVRLEKSVQIGAPLDEVFHRWTQLENVPQYTSLVRSVQVSGSRSHWVVNVDGRDFEWDAEITQMIPNESIGWKSVRGTKTTGRVNFAKVGEQTLVHVQMNYAPRFWALRPFASAVSGHIEGSIEQALRDFKSQMESGEGAWLVTNSGSTGGNRSSKSDIYGGVGPGPGRTITSDAGTNKVRTGNFGGGSSTSTPSSTTAGGGARGSAWNSDSQTPNTEETPSSLPGQATGTEGVAGNPNANPRFGTPDEKTVDYTRPPEESYLKNK